MKEQSQLYRIAFILAVCTIIYNIAEGLLATYLGFEDESLALFGFGIDSFVEVISGIGIVHMVLRIQNHPESHRDAFEKTALKITGTAFYILTAGLLLTSAYNMYTGHKPITTIWGIVISSVSIIIMWVLIVWKRKIGKKLNSAPILADANCTLVCLYMSIVLLVSSGVYEIFNFPYIDSLGGLGLAYFAFNEGRECFQKVKSNNNCGCE